MAQFHRWREGLLAGLATDPNHARLNFLEAWQACEGGTARNNPLNTTYWLQGCTSYNRAGVRNYADPAMGLAATLLTIRLGFYVHLRAALRKDGLTARAILRAAESDVARWGTSPDCIARRLSSR